jgi:hypothetical protein
VSDQRRALLTAALGFLQLRQEPPEVAMLRQWLDTWLGVGHVVTGLNAQGFDLELRQGSERLLVRVALEAAVVSGAERSP